MRSDYYKKIEKYLYHLFEPEVLVQEVRDYYIARMNVSKTTWLKGQNSMENQIAKLMDSKQLKEIKIWLEFLKDTLAFYKIEKPRFYGFIRLKYLRKRSDEDIQSVMKLDKKKFKELKNEVIGSIYIRAVLNGIVKKR
ncbi:MAG: hypothetical protein IKJ32_07100 [Clostridia bacterium]|nr:hypothetical protein [Clostridia bacterium]